jgi:hypothetical protein
MKKFFLALAAAMVLSSVSAHAGVKFGVTGGLGFNTAEFTKMDVESRTGWNAGVTFGVELPMGFSLQPSVVYHQKGANLAKGVSLDMGYLEVPVSLQWGPDLLIFRPFVDVTPYVGYALSNDLKADIAGLVNITDSSWEGKQRFEYGLGIGGGIDVWKLRLIARYNWNFGSLYNVDGWNDIKESIKIDDLNAESPNFGGVTVTLSYFF